MINVCPSTKTATLQLIRCLFWRKGATRLDSQKLIHSKIFAKIWVIFQKWTGNVILSGTLPASFINLWKTPNIARGNLSLKRCFVHLTTIRLVSLRGRRYVFRPWLKSKSSCPFRATNFQQDDCFQLTISRFLWKKTSWILILPENAVNKTLLFTAVILAKDQPHVMYV